MLLRLPTSTLFPYTTLFRSHALLQDAQQLRLQGIGHVPDLVEEERAAVGELELAGTVAVRPGEGAPGVAEELALQDRKSTRLNSSHEWISYAVFCLKKKNTP